MRKWRRSWGTTKIRRSSKNVTEFVQHANMYTTYRNLSNQRKFARAWIDDMTLRYWKPHALSPSHSLVSREINSTGKKFRVKTSEGNVKSCEKCFQSANMYTCLTMQPQQWTAVQFIRPIRGKKKVAVTSFNFISTNLLNAMMICFA